jgi:CMP-N,N'-diacetyllegionaminic acid synthase
LIAGYSATALIPARGGSKGFPGKNLAELNGKTLLAHAISQARGAAHVDQIIVSSDARDILDEASRCGADLVLPRPAELATDTASTDAVSLYVLDQLSAQPHYLVLLQVTTPLRRSEDIDGAIALCHRLGAPACTTVTPVEKPPHWMYRLGEKSRLQPLMLPEPPPTRRQDAPILYLLNGAVYVVRTEVFRQQRRFLVPDAAGYVMPANRSVDIDSPADLLLAKAILESPNVAPHSGDSLRDSQTCREVQHCVARAPR